MPASARGRPLAALVIALGALGTTLVVPAPAAQPMAPVDVLRLVWWTDVGFPTPFAVSTTGPGGVVRLALVYDTLTWKDARGLIPWLATSWRLSPDGRRYTFTLHRGVRWQDGHPFSAEDVRFSFAYYRRHPFRWASVARVRDVVVVDPHTVSISLSEPFAPFLTEIAGEVPIIPEHVWRGIEDPAGAQALRVAVGTGPYRLLAYDPVSGQYRFGAYAEYFKGPPSVREIRYEVLPPEQQLLAIGQGRTDDALATDARAAEAFRARPPLRVLETEPLSIARLIFNTRRAPLDIRGVRQALAYALPRAQIAELATHGPALVASAGIIPPGSPWAAPHVMTYPYDPGRAAAVLDHLGDRVAGDGMRRTPSGERLRLELLAGPDAPEALLIQQALRRIGIEVALHAADPKTRASLVREGRFQIHLTAHIGVGGDPDFLRRWFAGEEANEFALGDALADPEFRRLADAQARALDPALRRQLIVRMQEILADELPGLPLYYRRFYWIYNGAKFRPFETRGGLLSGVPLIENKLAFLGAPGTP